MAWLDYRIVQAMRLLEQRMGEHVDFGHVAAEVGLSRHHFHRVFTAATKETPAEFLRRIRLDFASLRLRWTSEPTVEIAHVLGYESRAAFIRAFQRRFGVPPAAYRRELSAGLASPDGHDLRVVLREVDGFRILAKRYVGPIWNLAGYWEDFLAVVPDELQQPGKTLFVGLMYDDPRITRADRTRYECGVVVSRDFDALPAGFAKRGLHLMDTRPGRYCCLQHNGPVESISGSYDHVGNWALQNGRPVTEDPAIEIHAVPRSRQPGDHRQFTILLAVE